RLPWPLIFQTVLKRARPLNSMESQNSSLKAEKYAISRTSPKMHNQTHHYTAYGCRTLASSRRCASRQTRVVMINVPSENKQFIESQYVRSRQLRALSSESSRV